MQLFPIGAVSQGSSSGTIESVSYTFFEPNLKVMSSAYFTTLQTRFEDQTILTRKKAEPYLVMNFEYENIFNREYRQLEHFVDSKDGALTSFMCPDLSEGYKPSNVASVTNDWRVYIPNTRLYSTINKQKAHYAFLWDGKGDFRIAPIGSISTNSYIQMSISASNLAGALTLSDALSNAHVYPLYQVFFNENPLQDFKTTYFIDENINLTADGGWMYSGTIQFLSKFKV